MMNKLQLLLETNQVLLALLAGIFTWIMTALGAAIVIFFKKPSEKITNIMLGFASGVMIAASFWSLLAPAIDKSEHLGMFKIVPVLCGFLSGGLFIRVIEKLLSKIKVKKNLQNKNDGMFSILQKNLLLILSITIHNIPEGLAVGVAFGAIQNKNREMLLSAIVLAIGIGIQNFPEGAAVSVPLRASGMSRKDSFLFGQLSAIVEPIFAAIGAAVVVHINPILPFALAFAAGAMIYVVVEELVPESQVGGGASMATIATMGGFAIMMVLDVSLG